ncbi:DNA repair protein RecN [Mycetocola reblochoni]|uniref:DNA repair protein RecN n=2 Tax=Mycetocola reblochoni TaxID=331618 RepID=A0A1R4IZW5_9MICO|nr:DNA repair protein RecN [Mycetocola reblochoni]RLP68806.1 DNA repair protein RecN [Mycetocola reblochoni]SJN25208.1 DNA repair protein RecN [Mycetocola reblochoni REB411]
MIEEIRISDLGVIQDATLPLGPGFTAITGETGAGKTMVVNALGLLRGAKADNAAVRVGAERAIVEGSWIVPSEGPAAERVRESGGDLDPVDDGSVSELIVTRTIAAGGRSRASVGGRSAPAAVLVELGEQLVAVHGQSDQIRLTGEGAQRAVLDRFGGPEVAAARERYQHAHHRVKTLGDEHDALVADRDERRAEAERLRAALEAIEAVDPQDGEDRQLDEQIQRLSNIEALRAGAARALALLRDEEGTGISATGLLDEAQREAERVSVDDPAAAEIAQTLAGLAIQAADAATELARYLGDLDASAPSELEQLHERRAELGELMRRYGPGLPEVHELNRRGVERLVELDGDDDRVAALREELDAAVAERAARAEELTALRRTAAERLAGGVSEELTALAMPDATLQVELIPREEPGPDGAEQVALLLTPHAGAQPRPLGRGASGGELSRVMLALEVVIAGSDPVPTFVFDEVDAGVGGAAAIEIGRRLARLARNAQVIVVTHLAQVAAFAGNHLSVVKSSDGTVTSSSVRQLAGDERREEMARLLSGLAESQSAVDHAAELLELGEQERARASSERD